MGVVSRMLAGVVVMRYIDFLILFIPIYYSCISSFFEAASLLFVHFSFSFFIYIIFMLLFF